MSAAVERRRQTSSSRLSSTCLSNEPESLSCIHWPTADMAPLRTRSHNTATITMTTSAPAPRIAAQGGEADREGVALLILENALFGRLALNAVRQSRTFGHDARSARDRIGEVEVDDGRGERRLVDRAAERGELPEDAGIRGSDRVEAHEVGIGGGERGAQLGKRIERQSRAERVRQRAQDGPVLARVPWRKHRALGELRPPLGV